MCWRVFIAACRSSVKRCRCTAGTGIRCRDRSARTAPEFAEQTYWWVADPYSQNFKWPEPGYSTVVFGQPASCRRQSVAVVALTMGLQASVETGGITEVATLCDCSQWRGDALLGGWWDRCESPASLMHSFATVKTLTSSSLLVTGRNTLTRAATVFVDPTTGDVGSSAESTAALAGTLSMVSTVLGSRRNRDAHSYDVGSRNTSNIHGIRFHTRAHNGAAAYIDICTNCQRIVLSRTFWQQKLSPLQRADNVLQSRLSGDYSSE
jgi:hypothetical protein